MQDLYGMKMVTNFEGKVKGQKWPIKCFEANDSL